MVLPDTLRHVVGRVVGDDRELGVVLGLGGTLLGEVANAGGNF
jgi:hypothetical protein